MLRTKRPSALWVIKTASGLVLKISSRLSRASRATAAKRWLTRKIKPNVHSDVTMSPSKMVTTCSGVVAVTLADGRWVTVWSKPTNKTRPNKTRPWNKNTPARKLAAAVTARDLYRTSAQAVANDSPANTRKRIVRRTTMSL